MDKVEAPSIGAGRMHVAFIVLGFSILVMNAHSLVTIARTRALRTTSNMYVASLSATDLAVGVLLVGIELGWDLGYHRFLDESRVVCLSVYALYFAAVLLSVNTLVMIAVDRYIYISRPFFYKRTITLKRVAQSLVTVWLLSAGLAALVSALKITNDTGNGINSVNSRFTAGPNTTVFENATATVEVCSSGIRSTTDYYVVMPLYSVSVLVSGVLYGLISRIAFKQLNTVAAQRMPQPGHSSLSLAQLRQRLRVVKMFSVVFGVFFVCYTPYFVVHTLHRLVAPVSSAVQNACLFPLLLNSLLNVPICLALNSEFRAAFAPFCDRRDPETAPNSNTSYRIQTLERGTVSE